MANRWKERILRVVMRKTLRKMDMAGGHGMNGTDQLVVVVVVVVDTTC